MTTREEIEVALESFTTTIVEIARAVTPKLPPKPTAVRYSKSIRKPVKKRRQLRHRWQRTRVPAVRNQFNSTCTKLRQELTQFNNNSFQSFFLTLDATKDTNYSLWEVAKAASHSTKYVPPIRQPDGSWARSDQEAKAFATHLKNTSTPHDIDSPIVPEVLAQQPEYRIPHIRPAEIREVIR